MWSRVLAKAGWDFVIHETMLSLFLSVSSLELSPSQGDDPIGN